MELRRDRKIPMKYEDKNAAWTQFFLDDADSPMLVDITLFLIINSRTKKNK